MVYPGEVLVNVELQSQLDSDSIACSVETDTSCTAVISDRDIYTVTISQSNDVGPTINMETFNGNVLLLALRNVYYVISHSQDNQCHWRDVELKFGDIGCDTDCE